MDKSDGNPHHGPSQVWEEAGPTILMKPNHLLLALLLPAACGGCRTMDQQRQDRHELARYKIASDHANYYSSRNLSRMAAGFGMGAAMAHTDVDQELRDWWQEDVRSAGTDRLDDFFTPFGKGEYVIAAAGAGLLIGKLGEDTLLGDTVGQWGDRTMRALLVGSPSLIFMQAATGASRPGESSAESDWVPFHDSNGVSGHVYIGALPFITAAQMTDSRLARASLYLGSTMTGIARINDDAHYTSQVLLGWWMAYLACNSISGTNDQNLHWELMPLPMPGGAGVGLVIER